LVVFGGEQLDTGPLLGWLDRHPGCRLVNMYGITETTVHVTAQELTRRDLLDRSRSVGRPLPGWRVYVLDPYGRPLPPGVAGEIYVGGAGVARGYLNRPDLTAARFLPDPFASGTMYRSGDRGRFLPDGRLEHLGRLDSQVKLRGHRIELGEVRARLLDAPGVAAATVVLRPDPEALHAYVVRHDDGTDPDEVLRHAARFLPAYMVPATVTTLPALPLTANGKVDQARLPDPRAQGCPDPAGAAGSVAAGSVAESVIAAWESVFGVRVLPDDDFFTLGGNSLLAVRLAAALRGRGLPPVPLAQIYLRRTVGGLTELLSTS
jgi:acyl-coenzyme A synthetase/AMP-(fatty) acid ligase